MGQFYWLSSRLVTLNGTKELQQLPVSSGFVGVFFQRVTLVLPLETHFKMEQFS